MPFGKHRGLDVRDLPSSYLEWLIGLDDLRGRLRTAVEREWRYRQWEAESHRPVADTPLDSEDRTLLSELIRAGYRVLALRYHPDVGGDPDTMRRLNRVMEYLRGALAA